LGPPAARTRKNLQPIAHRTRLFKPISSRVLATRIGLLRALYRAAAAGRFASDGFCTEQNSRCCEFLRLNALRYKVGLRNRHDPRAKLLVSLGGPERPEAPESPGSAS